MYFQQFVGEALRYGGGFRRSCVLPLHPHPMLWANLSGRCNKMISRLSTLHICHRSIARMASSSTVPATAVVAGSKVSWTRPDGSDEVPGYAFGPADSKKAVIVIQEWWGVTEDTKAQANYIGEQGECCLRQRIRFFREWHAVSQATACSSRTCTEENSPWRLPRHNITWMVWIGPVPCPMYVRESPNSTRQILAFDRHQPATDSSAQISGAAKFLKEQGADKVGVTGFCMGGALALASAVHSPDISACAPFYGTPPAQLADVKTIKVPVLAQFGEQDDLAGFSDPAAVKQLEASLKEAGVEADVFSHPDVGHGFMNSTPVGVELNEKLGRPVHNPAAINSAWDKLLSFLNKHLQ